MAIHTRMAPAADSISYANYPKFFKIFKGDFTAVPMEKRQIFATFPFSSCSRLLQDRCVR
jgi:hypothetical protein